MLKFPSLSSCSKVFIILCLTYKAETIILGAVRFYRNDDYENIGQGWSSGIVQISYGSSGNWGNICDDLYFGLTEANVICHQFSFSGASSFTNAGSSSQYGTDLQSTILEDVDCSSNDYLTISQCSFRTQHSSYCQSNSRDVIVTCYSIRIWSTPVSGDIRLTKGNYSNVGLLEVYCNGEWGTVCDDTFSSTHAFVACNQLGYNDYLTYNHLIHTSLSSQGIWFDALGTCSAYDTCLTSCQACPSSENHNCIHLEDVTLECVFNSSYHGVLTGANDVCNSIASSTTVSGSSTVKLSATSSASSTDIIKTTSTTTLSAIPTAASSDTSSTDIIGATSTALPTDVIIGIVIGAILIVVTCCVVVILCVYYWLRISKKSRNYNILRIINPASTMQAATTTNETLSRQSEPTAPITVYPPTTLTNSQEPENSRNSNKSRIDHEAIDPESIFNFTYIRDTHHQECLHQEYKPSA